MSRRNDDGAALILAICLTLVASVIGASLVMLAQTETYASLNYRLMSQSRYAAESGVQNTVNSPLYTYVPPTTSEMTSDGTTSGARPAKVQVTAILERQVTTVAEFGFFATDPNCGALTFQGGMTTDSYDSANMTMSGGHPVVDLWGGNVGSNGNL